MKKEQIDILVETFEEWLQIHDLDYDFWIFTRDEWRARGEEVLQKAEVVLAFENQLLSILNYTGPWEIEDELQDLAHGFGYYFEMGHHWNLGFYPLDRVEALPSHSVPYSQLLLHPRWQAKRNRILSRSGGHCEECGATQALDVHHCYYRYGRLPWQYPDGALLSLCRDCHARRGKSELRFRMFMTRLRTDALEQIRTDSRDKANAVLQVRTEYLL
jgi:5-methylcytosine-specific restriction endonuclease McrA